MKKTHYLWILCLAIGLVACKPEKAVEEAPSETVEAPADKYTLTPFTPSPEFEDAQMTSMAFVEGKFDFEPRGKIAVKGKGEVETCFLTGEAD